MNDALLKVATGLKLVFYGLMTMIAAVVIMFLGICVVAAAAGAAGAGGGRAPAPAAMGGMLVVVLAGGGLYLIGALLDLVGRVICLAVPADVGAAKSLITISVVLQLASIAGNIAGVVDNLAGEVMPFPVKVAIALGSGVSGIAAWVLFILFIRSVCLFVGRRDLAGRAMLVIWLCVALVVSYIAALGTMFAAGLAGQGGGAGGPAMAGAFVGCAFLLAVIVLGLVAFVLYAMLLSGSSAAVRAYAQGGRYDDDYDDGDDGYEGPLDDYDDRRGGPDDRPQRPWDRG